LEGDIIKEARGTHGRPRKTISTNLSLIFGMN
jgi:hypothetical protein